jgi:CubicO group peptidase (beta-lactamase class C family)
LQEGVWQGQVLVEADYVRESIQPFPNGVDQEGNLIDWYGYQFWVAPLDDGPVPHFAGILGQYIFILPELDAVVVRLGHRDDQDFQDGEIYLQAARSILENR